MIIQITDDFSLSKIAESGQCFRVREFDDGMFRFFIREHVLYISEQGDGIYTGSCSPEEWQNIWVPYFDLDRNYRALREKIPVSDSFLKKAAAEGSGIRILAQDHWETLVSFIISQRKSIPAIKSSIELLCSMYGTLITTPYETVYTFPTAEALADITAAELTACKTGYRAGYILDAISRANSGLLPLSSFEVLPDDTLFERLTEVRGVGKKVANCISLFSYGRTASAPVDTWIQKVMDRYYGGENPFPVYGDGAGIMQQYVFYYALQHKDEFRSL